MTELDPGTVVCRSEAMLFNNIGDEVVMMDIERGSYYGLEKVAARIWALTERPASITSLCEQLTTEYDVPREQCEREVASFIAELIGRGIVTRISG